MKSIKKMIISTSLLFLLIAFMNPTIPAESEQIINDDLDDVMSIAVTEDEIVFTSEKPNIDIDTITYMHADNSNEVSVTLKVKGEIEDGLDPDTIYDDIDDLEDFNLSEPIILYQLILETSYNLYEIDYASQTCTVNQENASYTIQGSELTITFDLATDDETYVSLIGMTSYVSLSLFSGEYYVDIAPNDQLFEVSISAPITGTAKESISFSGSYSDMLDISDGPYTYSWDWNDGSSKGSGSNPSHTFQFPGTYEVELTIEDSTGLSSTATHEITITAGSGNNNGGNGGNGGESDGSGLMLFIGVVIVIVIIGIIALVVVIRR